MPVKYANQRERAFQNMQAKSKVRLQDPATGEFLHMSGSRTTKTEIWAWLGHRYQAETLQKRAKARGEEWPYQPVPRDQTEDINIYLPALSSAG